MTWHGIYGHDRIVERFRRGLARGRLASTFLFVGPSGVGKRTFALKLAQAMLCETRDESQLDPCGECPACVQVKALTHPDLELISKPKDKSFIPVELFIGDREHRMREGLCHNISLKPFYGGRKIAIIDDADLMNREGANCLLKTLEEPPPRSVIILIGTSRHRQLPTIRSRSQIVRFDPLPIETVATLLVANGSVDNETQARQLAELSGGSLQQAMELTDETLREFRERLLDELSDSQVDGTVLGEPVMSFVDEAGKEAPLRRARMRHVIFFAAQFYRQLMRALGGTPIEGDQIMQRCVSRAYQSWPGDEESAAVRLERCLDALAHVDANANQTTLLACWLDDLSLHGAGR